MKDSRSRSGGRRRLWNAFGRSQVEPNGRVGGPGPRSPLGWMPGRRWRVLGRGPQQKGRFPPSLGVV